MIFRVFIGGVCGLALAHAAFAHEAYMVENVSFWNALRQPNSLRSLDALKDPHNLGIALAVACGIFVLLVLNFLFRWSGAGVVVDRFLQRFTHAGPLLVRAAIAAALFFSALSASFLGSELPVSALPYASVVQILLFATSVMIAVGFLTELAAGIGITLFLLATFSFGPYLFTYLNYLGEFIVLVLFGMRVFSVDRKLLGPLRRFQIFEKYETLIVRVFYGCALVYAGFTVKLLHPEISMHVVTEWNLTQFHWLFPSDPLLVVLGAGIIEILIGLFIIVGFELRLAVLVSLFYLTLSLIYFRELVWPHLLLYGISINLLVQPETFTLDHILFKHHRKQAYWWSRPFHAHMPHGKSTHGHHPLT